MRRAFFMAAMCALATLSVPVRANVYSDDFSGNLDKWTAGPSHLDNYEIRSGELFIDGWGHLTNPGQGGWGVLQFNQDLGARFVATWDARITGYDYANFVLFADSPWDFSNSLGYADNGYGGWLDIDDPTNPLLDVVKRSGGSSVDLPTAQRNISVTPDIPNNQWFSWKVVMDMGQMSVYVDDVLYVDTYDPQFANSNYRIGVSFGEDSQGYIDNFQVTVVPVPGAVLLGVVGLGVASARLRKRG